MSGGGQDWSAVTRGTIVSVLGGLAMVAIKSMGFVLRAIFGGPVYGLFVIAYNLVELATFFLLGGFVDSVVLYASRHLPRTLPDGRQVGDEDRLYAALATCIGVPALIGLVLAVAVQFLAPWLYGAIWSSHDPQLVSLVQRLAWTLPLFALMQLPLEAIKAHLRWTSAVVVSQVVFPLTSVVGAIALHAWTGRGILALVDGVLLAFAVAVPLSLWSFSRHFRLGRLVVATVTLRWDLQVLGFALPQGLNMALNQGLVRVDSLILSAWVSADAVGIYSLVSELTQLIRLAKMAFSGVYSPLVARYHAVRDFVSIEGAMHRMAMMTSLAAIPLLLVVMSVYPALILGSGETWTASPIYPWLLTAGPLMSCFFGLAGNTLLMVGRARLVLFNAIVAGTLNVVLNLAMVPAWGVIGAALATAIASVTISTMQIVELAHFDRLRFRASLYARTLGAAVVPVALVAWLGSPTGEVLHGVLGWESMRVERAALAAASVALFAALWAVMPGPSALRAWREAGAMQERRA